MRRILLCGFISVVMGSCAALGSPIWTRTLVTRGHTYKKTPDGGVVIDGGFVDRTTTRVCFWDSDACDQLADLITPR